MRATFLVLLALVSGCAVAPDAVLRNAQLPPAHNIIATDSRLRIISASQQGVFSSTGQVEPKRIICTEPSPDVATTIANSFGAGLSVLGRGSVSLSAQQVEGLVQLGERTAAIQLLRDKMYQACIAYANGAISGTTYSVIMSRLDDSIVTLSLGDGAAGAFGRKLAGVGGEATAKAEATLVGLPREVAKIEEQAGKLAAANQKVDAAEKALQGHKATQPASGKEQDYKAQTDKLEADLATAKAERNALLDLLRSTARTTSEATGKISQLQAGGSLTARPDAGMVLREMHGEFMLADSNRDLVFACMVELGLRGASGANDMQEVTAGLKALAQADPGNFTSDYIGSILRGRDTGLTEFCQKRLYALIGDSAAKAHEYRMYRARLNAETAKARYGGDAVNAVAREREVMMDSVKLCNTEFKDDAERKKACLDKVIPIQTAEVAKPKGAQPKREAVKSKAPKKDAAKAEAPKEPAESKPAASKAEPAKPATVK